MSTTSRSVPTATKPDREMLRAWIRAASVPEGATTGEIEETLCRLLDDQEEQERRTCEMRERVAELAHRINNPLTSLIGRAQLLQMNPAADEKTRRAAEVIQESATRVADYVKELATVVRGSGENAAD